MPLVRRDQVCPTCGQCLGSGFTQEGFDELYARDQAAKLRLEAWERDAEQSRKRGWIFFVTFAGSLVFGAAIVALTVWLKLR
jgi:hypothetical protein